MSLEPYKKLKVKLKDGRVVPFGRVMSTQQSDLLSTLQSTNRVIVVKARQIGISTACRLWQVVYALRNPGKNIAILSNKIRSARELGQIDALALQPYYQYIKRVTQDEIEFKNGSRILRFSGASRNDRGYTLHALHVTEYAFIEHGPDVLASVLASMAPDAKVVLESTPSHYGDSLHQLIQGESSWTTLFFSWQTFPFYRLIDESYTLTDADKAMGLSIEQAAWRAAKIAEYAGDLVRFKREYPSSIEEAYSLAGGTYIEDLKLPIAAYSKEQKGGIESIRLIAHTQKGVYKYVIGYDTAGGNRGDYSVGCVWCVDTGEIVQVVSSNTTSIQSFTQYLTQISDKWNKAMIHVEANNHGSAAKVVFDSLNFSRYYSSTTTAASKVSYYDVLRTYIYEKRVHAIDAQTAQEIKTLQRHPKGLAPSAAAGCHDDRCMALCLAINTPGVASAGKVPISGDKYDYLYVKKQHR